MGALGRPHFLWGLVMFAFWALSRLQWRTVDVASVSQPIRFAFTTLFVIALVGFAAAMLRGQPTDQVSQLTTSVLRLLSWAGVLLVIIDGVRTMRDVARIIRFAAVGASLLAALALLQAFTGQSFLDFWGSIPGVDVGEGGLAERAGRIRSAATATHPLEFGTILNAALPLCIACAFTRGFGSGRMRSAAGWWAASALLAVCASNCLETTCEAALTRMWDRARSASDSLKTSMDVLATGTAHVGPERQAVELVDGAWVGRLTREEWTAQSGGSLTGVAPR